MRIDPSFLIPVSILAAALITRGGRWLWIGLIGWGVIVWLMR